MRLCPLPPHGVISESPSCILNRVWSKWGKWPLLLCGFTPHQDRKKGNMITRNMIDQKEPDLTPLLDSETQEEESSACESFILLWLTYTDI